MINVKFFSATDHGIYLSVEKPTGNFYKLENSDGYATQNYEVERVFVATEDLSKITNVVVDDIVKRLLK